MPDFTQIKKLLNIESYDSRNIYLLIDSEEMDKTAKIKLTELVELEKMESEK